MSAEGGYQFELVRSEAGFRELESDWRALYSAAHVHNPFWSYDWVSSCRATIGVRTTPYVLTLRRDGRLVGVAPLRVMRERGFRVLRFIGDRRSDYQGFLLSPGEPQLEGLLLEELARRSGEWDLALLRQLNDERTGLEHASVPASLRARSSASTRAPYLRLPGDWAEFCKRGPPSVRRAIRAERKFLREGGTVERVVGEGMAQHLEALADVEARSWKARRGRLYLQPGPIRALLREALERLGPRGEMEIWLARMDGRPVAFLLNFVTPEQVCFYLGAYDDHYRRYFPGGILHYRCLQRMWEAGLREYDLLSGEEPYKYDWASEARVLRHRGLFPARLRGYLAYAVLLGLRWYLKRYAFVREADRLQDELRGKLASLRRDWRRRVAGPPRNALPPEPPAHLEAEAAPRRPALREVSAH